MQMLDEVSFRKNLRSDEMSGRGLFVTQSTLSVRGSAVLHDVLQGFRGLRALPNPDLRICDQYVFVFILLVVIPNKAWWTSMQTYV
jgi:hypothetical protein